MNSIYYSRTSHQCFLKKYSKRPHYRIVDIIVNWLLTSVSCGLQLNLCYNDQKAFQGGAAHTQGADGRFIGHETISFPWRVLLYVCVCLVAYRSRVYVWSHSSTMAYILLYRTLYSVITAGTYECTTSPSCTASYSNEQVL